MGNQEIYDNTKNVFAFTASAMCPIGKAYVELGKLSFRTVGTIVGEHFTRIVVKKNDVNMKDLSALTAKTGDEFAMFTRGSQRLIVRGNTRSVNITSDIARELHSQGYKWSGHTHPGIGSNVKFAFDGDIYILERFNQSQSAIYDSQGSFNIFDIGE